MCTAVSVTAEHHYFGRNLDYEHGFGEKIVITPRNRSLRFQNGVCLENHYAMIGTAVPVAGYPLYFDATNEAGLSVAALNFPEYTVYQKADKSGKQLASFELILWLLSQCRTTEEAVLLLGDTVINDSAFSNDVKPSPLHWMIADRENSVVIEPTECGLQISDNPVGVLTNSPTFDMHMVHLSNFMSLTAAEATNRFSKAICLKPYSRGMGALGLPGDYSSMSRFVRASFMKLNSHFGETEAERVNSFFHLLDGVLQHRGCVQVDQGFEKTRYSSCCNTDTGVYYYTTYYNRNIRCVDLYREDLEAKEMAVYPFFDGPAFAEQNIKS